MPGFAPSSDVNNHIDWHLQSIHTGSINVNITNASWYKIQLIDWTGSKIPELQPIFVYQMFDLQFIVFWIVLIIVYIQKIIKND